MANPNAIAWTPEMDALIGTASDAKVGATLGLREGPVRYRRLKLGLPAHRLSRGAQPTACSNCAAAIMRKPKDAERSRKLYCSRTCADAGQKRRDTETLRYGPGWKARRAEIRERDRVCRSCSKTPEQNGRALHVHHLVPFRYGGTNLPENLVTLCDSCHHAIEATTNRALESIRVAVSLEGSTLTVKVDGAIRWRGSARGAVSPTAND